MTEDMCRSRFRPGQGVSQATLSSTGMLLGTAAYLAPEMIQHNQATRRETCIP